MAETHGSLPEGHSGGSPKTPVPKGSPLLELDHDIRTPASNIEVNLTLIELRATDDEEIKGHVEDVRREMGVLTGMVKEAGEKEPLPDKTLGEVHKMTRHVLENICAFDPKFTGKCIVVPEEGPSQEKEARNGECVRIVIDPLPEELRQFIVRFSSNALRRIFDNLLKNSMRKGAKNIRVSIERSDKYEVAMSVSDDGEGMKLKLLDKLRNGEESTDKESDDMKPGGSSADHGHGLRAVRRIVVERAGGKMEIFSKKKDNLEDSGGFNLQDPESENIHPFEHGVTMRFTFHIHSMRLNGETKQPEPVIESIMPAQPVQEKIARRDFIASAAVTTVAIGALGGILKVLCRNEEAGIVHRESPPTGPASPLSNLVFDDNNRLVSFDYVADGRKARYEGGDFPRDIIDVRPLAFDGLSVTAIAPTVVNKRHRNAMYVCGTPEGTLAYLEVPMPKGPKMAFAHAPHGSSDLQPKLLNDTVLHLDERQGRPMFDATNMDVVSADNVRAMAASLEKILAEIGRSRDGGGAAFNNFGVISNLLSFVRAYERHSVSARDLASLLREIRAQEERFIIAEPDAIRELREERVPLLEKYFVAEKKSLCLRNMSPNEAKPQIKMS